jgi:hypothetical protein
MHALWITSILAHTDFLDEQDARRTEMKSGATRLWPVELLGELDWSQLDQSASLERMVVAIT